jgi:hypothetical protein
VILTTIILSKPSKSASTRLFPANTAFSVYEYKNNSETPDRRVKQTKEITAKKRFRWP